MLEVLNHFVLHDLHMVILFLKVMMVITIITMVAAMATLATVMALRNTLKGDATAFFFHSYTAHIHSLHLAATILYFAAFIFE